MCDSVMKKKIALIVDTRNWALDNIARNIEKNLNGIFDFKIIYMEDIPDNNIILLLYGCMDCDIIHFLWRGYLLFIDGDFAEYYLSYYGRGKEAYKKEVLENMYITMGVYDHKYLDDEINKTNTILNYVKKYTVSSPKLLELYEKSNIKKPNMIITDGVDLELFYPKNIKRFNNIKDRELVVGWVGNSAWNGDLENDYKGLNTIIKPVIEDLRIDAYNIRLECCDKLEKMIPHNKMVDYYKNIDVYICASVNEGTPNPVLEAMACGVPIISTNVGIVSEALGEKQKKYICKTREKEELKRKIMSFIDDLDNVKELVEENISQIKKWDWKLKTNDFRYFFEECLKDKEK